MNAHTPIARAPVAPVALEAGGFLGHAAMPPGFRYLLHMRTDAIGRALKPLAFDGLDGLARHLVRAALAGGGVQLYDQPLLFHGEGETRAGVSCWLLDAATQDRRAYLGWAWVNGASRETLAAALQRARPEALA